MLLLPNCLVVFFLPSGWILICHTLSKSPALQSHDSDCLFIFRYFVGFGLPPCFSFFFFILLLLCLVWSVATAKAQPPLSRRGDGMVSEFASDELRAAGPSETGARVATVIPALAGPQPSVFFCVCGFLDGCFFVSFFPQQLKALGSQPR